MMMFDMVFFFKEWGQSYSNTYDIYDVHVYINIVKYIYIYS